MQTHIVATLASYQPLITELLQGAVDTTLVVALHGDLGTGKTTFVQQLGRALGVTDVITSPTFSILSRYETTHLTWHTLLHMDAYRLETPAELQPLHFAELLTTANTIFCIEWAERIAAALPVNTVHLTFSIEMAEVRMIRVATHAEWLSIPLVHTS